MHKTTKYAKTVQYLREPFQRNLVACFFYCKQQKVDRKSDPEVNKLFFMLHSIEHGIVNAENIDFSSFQTLRCYIHNAQ